MLITRKRSATVSAHSSKMSLPEIDDLAANATDNKDEVGA
jgi:hypothetical protein